MSKESSKELLPMETFKKADRFRHLNSELTTLENNMNKNIEKACKEEIQIIDNAIERMNRKIENMRNTSNFRSDMEKTKTIKTQLINIISSIQHDCEKCVKGIRRMNISNEEKKKKIGEIADLIQSAMLSKEDYARLSLIKKQLETVYKNNSTSDNSGDRIEMLQ